MAKYNTGAFAQFFEVNNDVLFTWTTISKANHSMEKNTFRTNLV